MSFLNLPVDILIHILCVLDATDIVSMRQACKTLASIENTLYSTIWKSCTQGLCLEAPLFPPTLKWRLPPSKLHEIIARRASRFKYVLSLVASQGNASTAPLPRLNTELSAPPSWPNVPIGKVILVPGGRFLIILGESQPIQVYDLASYYVDGTAPVLIANFTLSHKFAVVHAAACTLAGPEASCVRLLLHEFINRSEATGFDLADDEAALRLVLYELRFERDTPCLACVGSLPMTYGRFRSPSIGAFFVFSTCGQRIGFVWTGTVVVWDFVSNTHAIWSPQLGHPLPVDVTEVRLSGDRFSMFAYHWGGESDSCIIFNLVQMSPLSLDKPLRLSSAPLASCDAQVYLDQRGLINIEGSSRDVWGLGPLEDSFPLWSWARNQSGVDTCWMSGGRDIVSQILTTHHRDKASEPQGIVQRIVGFRMCHGDGFILLGEYQNTAKGGNELVASISTGPNTFTGGSVQEVSLVSLLEYPAETARTRWDFCPLAGIVVSAKSAFTGVYSHTVTIRDFLRS
ncbi:hypothetical protein BKA70DRAFT_732572 [Coprinopsis sp. MPI-PUGE-AT-0042]|nr:hypothetical protein BKA70DRAFT_732572 [Coprinopsis sp. MPI-PUGE-AT-0042]